MELTKACAIVFGLIQELSKATVRNGGNPDCLYKIFDSDDGVAMRVGMVIAGTQGQASSKHEPLPDCKELRDLIYSRDASIFTRSRHALQGLLDRIILATVASGGQPEWVLRILDDPETARAIGRALVGPVWDMVGQPFDLEVNWDYSSYELRKRIQETPNLLMQPWLFVDREEKKGFRFIDPPASQPKPCRYTLMHYEEIVEAKDVLKEQEPAGFRELYAFSKLYRYSVKHPIVALDSFAPEQKAKDWSVPESAGYACLGSSGLFITEEPFGQRIFFLVRVPA